MASSSNENGNLMDEFEEAFQACLLSLTKSEPNTGTNKDEIELEVQKTTNRFIDVARQMEAFFLQKRFLVSTLKPDMLIKDENQDLRNEIARKEQLLNKHYSRLEEWKACLSDIQANQGVHNRPIGGVSSGMAAMNESAGMGATGMSIPGGLNIPQGPNRPVSGGMISSIPAYGVPRRF
ncbi:PREDICTED: mediator of RNA polymerase II transcription subunit 28-like [Rhagoletis zephyria]|uniref:mediator of RNA polymerase II transcription subunit 28-like n=1 Tax=Rhagoletis zephyria TaxID=28612 RepID=UPI0008114C4A|nr:PREDICTED: mediator of RNA polymerase II transcription subunit 28-like [Rhagoletis zephyria]XP_036321875.1 mediator of RNA polymerase II transcription subunit 28 [Rhagoletis pomonella]